MAVGDAVAVYLGTAATDRQPASGVEEQIIIIGKPDVNDPINIYDGVTPIEIFASTVSVGLGNPAATAGTRREAYNMAIMITNSVYLRKTGTSDRIFIGGIQTNS